MPTTLLWAARLGCLDTPTTGSYQFRGVHVEELSRNQRALIRRNFLGFVFQGYNLLQSDMPRPVPPWIRWA